jgi:hypothetical protein
MGMHEFLKNIKLDRAYSMLRDDGAEGIGSGKSGRL